MSKCHDRTPGLFKAKFQGTRMITLTSKCYYAEDDKSRAKFSCKGISEKQNLMSWERYLEALNRSIDKAQNTGFRLIVSVQLRSQPLLRQTSGSSGWNTHRTPKLEFYNGFITRLFHNL